MRCHSCGSEVQPGQRFCPECGARLDTPCSGCGAPLPGGARFCPECGTPTAPGVAGAPATPAATGTGPGEGTGEPRGSGPASRSGPATAGAVASPELRLVSVLFADLVGFTSASETRDPEDTRAFLDAYFERAREVIGRYGGTVEKFIGDAVMAVWGAPVAREDDAEQAVRAGLELVDAVSQLPGRDGPPALRVGILTGEAAVTVGNAGQAMVAGDLVNAASRLQSAAQAGSVLVGDATHRAASRAIAFESVGDVEMKGRAALSAWRALRVVAGRGGARRSEALEPPFVGRDDELRLLKDLFHTTSRESRIRVVSIVGPAGIGKSRLAWEFEKYIDGLTEPVYWHQGRSPAIGEGVTFWALGEMIRARARIAETDDLVESLEKLRSALAEYVPDDIERQWIEPRLMALLGLGEDPGGDRGSAGELFAAWRTFFERISALGTVVLVFEDLQWADSGLFEFIGHLLQWSRSHPIFVITLSRPEILERRPDWGAGQRNFTSLHLEPLDSEAMRALLNGLVPGLPEPAIRAILARAEGVPLYAVETVRMLVTDERLVREGDVYAVRGALDRLSVPETLHALVAARLDGLDPTDRTLLQDASILGLSFTADALATLSRMDQAEVDGRLEGLVNRELLRVEVDPRSPERGQYLFVQAVIREVAYGTLAKRERRARHLAAAQYFETLGDDEIAGILASHYVDAYRNATPGPEAETLAAQARVALRGAADRATQLRSFDQALAFLLQALAVTEDPVEQTHLRERAAEAASFAGHGPEASRLLEEAAAGHRAAGDRLGAARVSADQASAMLFEGQAGEVIELLTPILAEIDSMGDPGADPVIAAVASQLSRANMLNGEHPRAIELADRAIAISERLGERAITLDTLVTKGTSVSSIREEEGTVILLGAVRLARVYGLAKIELRARNNVITLLAFRDPRASIELITEGLELARRIGHRGAMVGFAGGIIVSAYFQGDWDLVEQMLAELDDDDLPVTTDLELSWVRMDRAASEGDQAGLEAAVGRAEADLAQITNVQQHVGHVLSLAWVDYAAGRFADGLARLALTGEAGVDEAERASAAGRLALRLGDLDRARSAAATIEATGSSNPMIQAKRRALDAGIAALEGRIEEAVSGYGAACERLADMGDGLETAVTRLEFAALVGVDRPEAQAAAAAARKTYERLGARAFLAQLDAIDAAPGRGLAEESATAPSTRASR